MTATFEESWPVYREEKKERKEGERKREGVREEGRERLRQSFKYIRVSIALSL